MKQLFTIGKLYAAIVDRDLFTGPIELFFNNTQITFLGVMTAKTPFVLLDYQEIVDTFYRVKALTSKGEVCWLLTHENQILPIEDFI